MPYVYNYVEYDTLKEAKNDAYADIDATEIVDRLSCRGICFENVIEAFLENSANPKKFHEWMREQVGQVIEDYFDENIWYEDELEN